MRISYNWLKDYIDIKASPEKLAELLTMAGLTVESVKQTADDYALEIEITANRPDWLSYIGVAREIAAITGGKMKLLYSVQRTEYREKRNTQNQKRRMQNAVRIYVENKALCPRYTARIIRNVNVIQSPGWLVKKIESMGLRPVNNIVDITNFCLFETGEPMHAFDLDKISGKEIFIRKAEKGGKIVTIDNVERALDDSILVIADKDKPIAIAGVMGGLNTEVNMSTKNILLEAAYFDPVSIRRTSRKLGISTDSSYRFERRVDVGNIIYSFSRAEKLICEIAGGKCGEMFDLGHAPSKPASIELKYSKVNKVLGLDIPQAKVKKILESLGIKIKKSPPDSLKCAPPSFRYDIKSDIDLIEEVARIYGYDKIPVTIPAIFEKPEKNTALMIAEESIRRTLPSLGAEETVTYSLIGKKFLKMADMETEEAVEIRNPLTNEQEILRPSLIIGMINSLIWNINRKSGGLKLFEIGKIYKKEAKDKYAEIQHLVIGITGMTDHNWNESSREYNLFDIKGMLEMVLEGLGIKEFFLKETGDKRFSPTNRAEIEVNDEKVGIIGEVAAAVLKNFDIKEKIYIAEISVTALSRHMREEKRYRGIQKYPSILRDISIVLDEKHKNSDIEEIIKASGQVILKKVNLIDRYKGKQIPEGRVSLTYRLEYMDPAKTLEEREVAAAHSKILNELEAKLGAKLR